MLHGAFYTEAQVLLIPRPNSKLFEFLVSFSTDAVRQNSDRKDYNHIERRTR